MRFTPDKAVITTVLWHVPMHSIVISNAWNVTNRSRIAAIVNVILNATDRIVNKNANLEQEIVLYNAHP